MSKEYSEDRILVPLEVPQIEGQRLRNSCHQILGGDGTLPKVQEGLKGELVSIMVKSDHSHPKLDGVVRKRCILSVKATRIEQRYILVATISAPITHYSLMSSKTRTLLLQSNHACHVSIAISDPSKLITEARRGKLRTAGCGIHFYCLAHRAAFIGKWRW
jgi:hypothetical protein